MNFRRILKGDLATIEELQNYPYIPYFYHRSLKQKALWKCWEKNLKAGIQGGTLDLFAVEEGDAVIGIVGIEEMTWDTEFFGKKTGRIFPYWVRGENDSEGLERLQRILPMLTKVLRQVEYRYLTVAFEFHDMPQAIAFQECGFRMVDSWITWGWDFDKQEIPERRTKFTMRPFNREDPAELEEVVAMSMDSFRENHDRFHNDPFFSNEDADRLYEEWTRNSLMVYDRHAIVCECDGFLGGYITAKVHKNANKHLNRSVGELELAAVSTKARGKGIYTDLFIAGLEWLRDEAKVNLAHEKTQFGNIQVQNAWKSLGLRIIRTAHVLRLAING